MKRRETLRTIGAVGATALAGCQSRRTPPEGPIGTPTVPAGSWPMDRHDPRRSGESTVTLSTAPTSVANVTRSNDVEAAPPVVRDGRLYLFHPDRVAAYRPDGTEEWRFETPSWHGVSPAVDAESVYVGRLDGRLSAIDTSDGAERWTFRARNGAPIRSSPVVVGSTVFVTTSARVYAVTTDGRKRWQYGPEGEWPVHEVAYAGETVYLTGGAYGPGGGGGAVEAIDARTGTREWRFDAIGVNYMPPTVAGDLVIAGGADGTVYALDRAEGTERWRFELPGAANVAPAVADGTVYLAAHNRNSSVALAADSGAVEWTVPTGRLFAPPVAVENAVLFGGGWTPEDDTPDVLGVGLDGTIHWERTIPRSLAAFAVANQTVYAVGSDPSGGDLYELT